MSTPTDLKRASVYAKKTSAKATVGESRQIAQMVTVPAVIAARWAVFISVCAVVISVLALIAALVAVRS